MKSSVSIGANIFCECLIHKIDFIEKCKKCKEILETPGRKISVLKDIEKSPQETLFNILLTGEIELLLNVVSSVFELPLEKIFIRSSKALNNLFDQLLNNIQHYTIENILKMPVGVLNYLYLILVCQSLMKILALY